VGLTDRSVACSLALAEGEGRELAEPESSSFSPEKCDHNPSEKHFSIPLQEVGFCARTVKGVHFDISRESIHAEPVESV
jgi:hypothetical protein